MIKEQSLIRDLKKGKEEAFRKLIDEHKEFVFRTAYGFLHDQDEAEDLAQEVFIEVFRSVKKFKGDSKIATWLYRITVNKSLNQLKKNKNRGKIRSLHTQGQDESGENMDVPEEDKQKPDSIRENEERKELIENAINKLPENQKTAFILHKYDGLPYKKITEVMDLSLSSVESLIHRAKQNLQKNLLQYYQI